MASLTDIIKSARFVRGAGIALALGAAVFPIKSHAGITEEICIIDAEGGRGPVKIFEYPAFGFMRYAWSPDGTRIVVANNDWSSTYGLRIIDTKTLESRVIEIYDPEQSYVRFIDNLSWSPDGTRIAFDSSFFYKGPEDHYYEREKICVINADGTNYREFVSDGLSTYENASWFWDGPWFVYTVAPNSEEFPRNHIAKVNVGATPSEDEVISLTEPDSNTRYPEVSPDGKHIVYYKELSDAMFQNRGEWWIMDSDGTNKRLLRPSNPYDDPHDLIEAPVWLPMDKLLYPPVWSSEETLFLAFHSWTGEQYFSDTEIKILNLNGEICQVIRPKEPAKSTYVDQLSPDGKSAVCTSNIYGSFEIVILDLRTNETRQLTFDQRFDTDPQLSPDGKRIAYVKEVRVEEE